MTEVELKILPDPAALPALRRRLLRLAGRQGTRRRLRSIYLDTAEQGLATAGMALRLRAEARRWTQTLKLGRSHRGGLSCADEIDVDAPGGRLNLAALPQDAADAVRAAAGGLPLAPVFETRIERTHWTLAHAGARIEAALDCGSIVAGGASAPIDELELERLEGDPAALFALARALFPAGGWRLSTLNKAERGARLGRGQDPLPPPRVRRAQAPRIARDATAEAAAVAILDECQGMIAENLAASTFAPPRPGADGHGGETHPKRGPLPQSEPQSEPQLQPDPEPDPEAPHQLRVGLRRLRAAVRLLRPALGGSAATDARLAHLGAEAQWLAREVGRLRDLQVARDELVRPAAVATPAEPGFAVLIEALDAETARAAAALRSTLAGPRATAFQWDLAAYVALWGWLDPADRGQTARLARPFRALAAQAARAAERRAAKRAKRIATLQHEARHELRKALKMLRYIVEFAAPAWPAKRVDAVLSPLKALQDLFGELNDAATAEALFLAPDGPGAGSIDAARAAGRLIGQRTAAADHAWRRARARWAAFTAVKHPWAT